ncbi:hypothetical protein SMD44_05654 [Streptomyces alboflavus]|uniref:Uncharacterized protein n=1 Tax=Streptomyces alboflavus TaxID=67267 RepID=A0A1Z1WIB7_9ACTN|nr:hypothetical protein SMD44_05654 [Streptomyces alboflavus]
MLEQALAALGGADEDDAQGDWLKAVGPYFTRS